jgi:hypothetical protein
MSAKRHDRDDEDEKPEHPISEPPHRPEHPIVIPPASQHPRPEHPIVIPPVPERPEINPLPIDPTDTEVRSPAPPEMALLTKIRNQKDFVEDGTTTPPGLVYNQELLDQMILEADGRTEDNIGLSEQYWITRAYYHATATEPVPEDPTGEKPKPPDGGEVINPQGFGISSDRSSSHHTR